MSAVSEHRDSARVEMIMLGLLGLAVLLLTYPVACISWVGEPGQLGPRFWPYLVLAGLEGAIGWRLFTTWRIYRRQAPKTGEPAAEPEKTDWRKFHAGVVLSFLYALAIDYLAFWLSTILFLFIAMRLWGYAKTGKAILISCFGGVAICYIFISLTYLPLPLGMGIFRPLSVVVYRLLGIY